MKRAAARPEAGKIQRNSVLLVRERKQGILWSRLQKTFEEEREKRRNCFNGCYGRQAARHKCVCQPFSDFCVMQKVTKNKEKVKAEVGVCVCIFLFVFG